MAEPTAPTQNPDVAWAVQEVRDRLPAIQRRRDYREGRHLSVIPDAQTLSPLLSALLADLSDNLCDDVVEETVGRLQIVQWAEPETPDDETEPGDGSQEQGDTGASPRAQRAQDLWEANRGPAREPETYRDLFGTGDAYNIVEKGEDGRVRWFPQDPAQMAVAYQEDRPDTLRVAARVWRSGNAYRLNLYYGPDDPGGARLERYATRGLGADGGIPQARAFLPYAILREDGEAEPEARDWTRVPVFHFPCDTIGGYGASVLTPVIPLQDLLNKAIADLVVNMEETALDQRWGTGIQAKTDPITGEELPLRRRARRAGDMITTASTEAQFGAFPSADLQQFLPVIQHWRVEIARKGYLPPYIVGEAGDASGLSLLVQEGRQVKRCKSVGHRDAGWVWREQMAYMLTLDGIPTEPGDLEPIWAPVETRDETALWELLMVKSSLGVPRRVLLVEGGYDPDEVEAWLEDAAAEQGGRVSAPGPGIGGVASVTVPGVSGGMAVPGGMLPGAPAQPAGANVPAVP